MIYTAVDNGENNNVLAKIQKKATNTGEKCIRTGEAEGMLPPQLNQYQWLLPPDLEITRIRLLTHHIVRGRIHLHLFAVHRR